MTREEAIKFLKEEKFKNVNSKYRKDWNDASDMAIEALSAVQGEWVRKEKEINDCDGHRAYYWYECSVCGARPPYTRFMNENLSAYCPNCGARMEANE